MGVDELPAKLLSANVHGAPASITDVLRMFVHEWEQRETGKPSLNR